MYSNDAPGTVRAASEYTQLADAGIESTLASLVSMPVMVGLEAGAVAPAVRASAQPNKGVPRECLDPVPSAPGPSRALSTAAGISRKPREQRGDDTLRKQRHGPGIGSFCMGLTNDRLGGMDRPPKPARPPKPDHPLGQSLQMTIRQQ